MDPTIRQLTCDECGRVYLSNAELDSHKNRYTFTNYDRYYAGNNLTYRVCQKTCRNPSGLTRQLKTNEPVEQALQNRQGPAKYD